MTKKELQRKRKRNMMAVQVDSEEQLGELRMLLEGDSESKSRELNVTAVLLAPRDAKQIHGRELRVVPGKVGSKVQPR